MAGPPGICFTRFNHHRRNRQMSGPPDICGLFSGRAVFIILAVTSIAHRLICKKLRVLSRLRRSQPAPNIRNPAPLRTPWCPCVASSSCLALGKCPQMPERVRHLRPLSSLLLTYFSAMTSCSQTCMNKLRAAPLLRALANHVVVCYRPTHSHPAPLQARSAPLRCYVLMCGRSQMSARPDMQAYPSLRPLARCLFIRR